MKIVDVVMFLSTSWQSSDILHTFESRKYSHFECYLRLNFLFKTALAFFRILISVTVEMYLHSFREKGMRVLFNKNFIGQ